MKEARENILDERRFRIIQAIVEYFLMSISVKNRFSEAVISDLNALLMAIDESEAQVTYEDFMIISAILKDCEKSFNMRMIL